MSGEMIPIDPNVKIINRGLVTPEGLLGWQAEIVDSIIFLYGERVAVELLMELAVSSSDGLWEETFLKECDDVTISEGIFSKLRTTWGSNLMIRGILGVAQIPNRLAKYIQLDLPDIKLQANARDAVAGKGVFEVTYSDGSRYVVRGTELERFIKLSVLDATVKRQLHQGGNQGGNQGGLLWSGSLGDESVCFDDPEMYGDDSREYVEGDGEGWEY